MDSTLPQKTEPQHATTGVRTLASAPPSPPASERRRRLSMGSSAAGQGDGRSMSEAVLAPHTDVSAAPMTAATAAASSAAIATAASSAALDLGVANRSELINRAVNIAIAGLA